MIRAIVVLTAALVLASSCGDDVRNHRLSATATDTVALTPTATATPDSTPFPTLVSFAPGETIDTGGKAGVVFLDPETGASEAWLLPGVPPNYGLLVGASDGHLLLYRCQHPGGWTPAPGCEGSVAWYVFNTATRERTRLEVAGDNFALVWPDAEDALAWVGGEARLINIQRPDESRTIPLASGYELMPGTAQWNRDGTAMVLSAFLPGAGHCGPTVPGGFYACSADPNLWQMLLLDRETGTTSELIEGAAGASAAWSPDGSRLVVTRASGALDKPSDISVYDRHGTRLWSQQRFAIWNLNWSPDGGSLAMQVLSKPERVDSAMRIDVLDAATGETRYRIASAIGCDGRLWTSDGARLVLGGASGFKGSVVANPRDGMLRGLGATDLIPSSNAPDMAYQWGYSGLSAVDIDTGEMRGVATFSSPLLIVGESNARLFNGRYAFTAIEPGGHGGCAESIEPDSPPPGHFEYPPFND